MCWYQRSCCQSHAGPEPNEHSQGDCPGAVEPETPRGHCKSPGQKAGGCSKSVLCWSNIEVVIWVCTGLLHGFRSYMPRQGVSSKLLDMLANSIFSKKLINLPTGLRLIVVSGIRNVFSWSHFPVIKLCFAASPGEKRAALAQPWSSWSPSNSSASIPSSWPCCKTIL